VEEGLILFGKSKKSTTKDKGELGGPIKRYVSEVITTWSATLHLVGNARKKRTEQMSRKPLIILIFLMNIAPKTCLET
jgi:hypothetical protein